MGWGFPALYRSVCPVTWPFRGLGPLSVPVSVCDPESCEFGPWWVGGLYVSRNSSAHCNMSDRGVRRGPALGGACLRICTDVSQTRGFVPTLAQQSVHGMPVIAGSMDLVRRHRTSYQRPPGSNITSQESTKPPAFWHSACKRTPSQEEME